MVESLDINSQDFTIVWLDSDAFKANYCVAQKQLLHTKVKSVKVYDDSNECIDYITNNQHKSILLFVSGILNTLEFREKIYAFINVEELHATEDTRRGFERDFKCENRPKFKCDRTHERRRFQGVRCIGFSMDINVMFESLIKLLEEYTLRMISPYPTRMTANVANESYGEKFFLNLIVIWLGSDLLKENNMSEPHSSSRDAKETPDHCETHLEFADMKDKLLTIVDNIMIFDNINEFADHVTDMSEDLEIHLIVTGHCWENVCLVIQQLLMHSRIYFRGKCTFDEIKKIEPLLKESKCRSWCCSSSVDVDGLTKSLKHDLDRAWEKLMSENVNARYKKENSYQNAFKWLEDGEASLPYICLMDCLPVIPLNTYAKHDIINDAQRHYKDDPIELDKIREFENSYCEERAIWWYTRDCFLYRLLNKVLRTQDIDIIFTYRLVLVHLYTQLKKFYDTFRNENPNLMLTFYRGQCLHPIEVYKLQTNIGGFITANTFLSATNDCDVACLFSGNGTDSPFIESVLLKIIVNTATKTTKPYAPIQNHSYHHAENEVLFFLGTRFKLISVTQDRINRIWTVQVELVSNFKEREEIHDYFSANKITNLRNFNAYLALAHGLSEMHEKKKSRRFYQMVIDEFPSSYSDVARAYMGLGLSHRSVRSYRKNDTDDDRQMALKYFEKALETYHIAGQGDLFVIIDLYLNISLCYIEKNDNLQLVIQYLEKSHDILKLYIESSKDGLDVYNLLINVSQIFQRVGNQRKQDHYLDLSKRFHPWFRCTDTFDAQRDLSSVLTLLKTKLDVSSMLSVDDCELINEDLEGVLRCAQIYERTMNDIKETVLGMNLTDDDVIDLGLQFDSSTHHVLTYSDGKKAFINKIFPVTINSDKSVTIHYGESQTDSPNTSNITD